MRQRRGLASGPGCGPTARRGDPRRTLGPSRLRIVRLFLTESLVLSVAGGALGIALAWYGLQVVQTVDPRWLSSLSGIHIDVRVLSSLRRAGREPVA